MPIRGLLHTVHPYKSESTEREEVQALPAREKRRRERDSLLHRPEAKELRARDLLRDRA